MVDDQEPVETNPAKLARGYDREVLVAELIAENPLGNDWVGVSGNNNYLNGAQGGDYIAATGRAAMPLSRSMPRPY